jgi:spermidine synthase
MAYLITLIVAFCSIIYELVMAQTLSVLLGNTVLQYSITIGVFLAALGIGAIWCKEETSGRVDRLLRIELWLSLVGGLSVVFQNLWDVFFKYFERNIPFFDTGTVASLLWIGYLLLAYGGIAAIGILSGFELPLLISLRKSEQKNTVNKVLGVDYFGSLVGAVCFPLLLWPHLGLFGTAFLTGLLNAFACALLLVTKRTEQKRRYAVGAGLVALLLLELLFYAPRVEQFFLRKLYYYQDVNSISQVFDPFSSHPPVEAHRSPYQRIHLVQVPETADYRRVVASYSDKWVQEPDFPAGYYLFLNRAYQFYSDIEEFWHEFFAHVPIQWTEPPDQILILGGGDGILAKELLKYGGVERITLVDLDPVMLELARNHPIFRKMNGDSFRSARVRLIHADAFSWIQDCENEYDAIYIDMPDPVSYELSKLYSVEFYSLVRRCVAENGFIAADIPYSEPYDYYYLWRQYYSTFYAAGFRQIHRFATIVELDNPKLREFEDEWVRDAEAERRLGSGAPMTAGDREAVRQDFKNYVNRIVYGMNQGFVFLQREESALNTAFRNDGIPLYVLNAERFGLSTTGFNYPEAYSSSQVNSIFRPTLPTLELSTSFAPSNPY